MEELFFQGSFIEEEPDLLFDKADSSQVDKEPYFGLKRYGPFSKQCSNLKIGIISPKSVTDNLRSFLKLLELGDSRFFIGGMKTFFRTNLSINHVEEVNGTRLEDYEDAGKRFVVKVKPGDVDVVLCHIPFTSNFYTNTPYYRLKAILSVYGFPSQMLTQKTLDNPTYSYLNVASAMFAKAGYIPWVLGSEMPNTDIIIGISVANRICDERRIIRNRYIGYVNVFDEYGKWLFFEGTAESYDKGDIPSKMVELVKRAVERYRIEKGVFPREIHIHYWKRFSKDEKARVNQMLLTLNPEAKIAYTSVNSEHPYKFYDLESDDGSLKRGYYVYFNDGILLSTTGTTTQFKRTFAMGTPKLLHIRTDQHPEEFITIDDVAYQILALTKLNWATSSVLIREPITLTFSQRLASLTSVITEGEWTKLQKDQINISMKNKPWFI